MIMIMLVISKTFGNTGTQPLQTRSGKSKVTVHRYWQRKSG